MIVLVQSAPAFGAIERYLVDVVSGLRKRDEEVLLLYPDAPELAPFLELEGGNVRIEPFAESAAPRVAFLLARRFRALRPRLVHVNDPMPPALVAARLARVPRLIVTHHTPELPLSDNFVGRVWRRLGWAARPEVIYTSEADRRTDSRLDLKTHVVYYGIDLERFVAAEPILRKDGPLIGNVARLVPQKGQPTLIDAAPAVLRRYPSARFILVGDGESRVDLERRAAALGVADRVVFLGERSDVPALLASFDVFALPSHFEGLCYAVIEAQAAGVPVVATPVGGVRENVVHGETGLVVEPENPGALSSAILHLLDDREDASRLVEAARQRVLERYAVDRMVAETLAIYS